MSLTSRNTSRRDFLKAAGASAAGVGIFAFAPGLSQIVEAVGPGVTRVTRGYLSLRVASLSELVEGEPLDFQYPLQGQTCFVVRLGVSAVDGVGPEGDIVAFSYLCSHMGCPLNGQYKHEHSMLGPCPCHYSRFDLSKNGILILGRATQSLPQLVLEVRDGDVHAVAVTGLVYGWKARSRSA